MKFNKPMYYRRDGTPYTGPNAMMEWADDFEDFDKRLVKRETLPNGVEVSTVWLGLDHSILSDRPLIFETMIFLGDRCDLDCWRYSTEEEAIQGHNELAKKWGAYKTAEEVLREGG